MAKLKIFFLRYENELLVRPGKHFPGLGIISSPKHFLSVFIVRMIYHVNRILIKLSHCSMRVIEVVEAEEIDQKSIAARVRA